MISNLLAALALTGSFWTAPPHAQEPAEPVPPIQSTGESTGGPAIEIVALANEGFLLRTEDTSVLIDAFVQEIYSIYGALSEKAHAQLVAGRPPFENVSLALVSHVHRDHFQPASAQVFLSAHPECRLVSSPQVIDAYERQLGSELPAEARVTVFDGEQVAASLEHEGVRVDFFRLSHGTGRFAKIQNLAHVITIGGLRVLHVGDAEILPRNFEPLGLGEREIDVALIPYWYFQSAAGRRILKEEIPGAQLIACHVPPGELEEVATYLSRELPRVILFQRELERREFRARSEHARKK